MEPCNTYSMDTYTLACSVHNRTFSECQSERIRILEVEVETLRNAGKAVLEGLSENWRGDSYVEYCITDEGEKKPIQDLRKLVEGTEG